MASISVKSAKEAISAGNRPQLTGSEFFLVDALDGTREFVNGHDDFTVNIALIEGGKVVFGATVELEEQNSGEQVTYQIVGEDEADLKLGLVNIGSPIARALIGKEEGDTAEVQTPGGTRRFEIVAVRYA